MRRSQPSTLGLSAVDLSARTAHGHKHFQVTELSISGLEPLQVLGFAVTPLERLPGFPILVPDLRPTAPGKRNSE